MELLFVADVLARIAPVGNLRLDPGGLVGWLLAGLLAGWLAGQVARGRGFGCLGDVLLGLIGAVIGGVILSYAPVNIPGTLHFFGTLVVAFLGAFVLALLGRVLGGASRYR